MPYVRPPFLDHTEYERVSFGANLTDGWTYTAFDITMHGAAEDGLRNKLFLPMFVAVNGDLPSLVPVTFDVGDRAGLPFDSPDILWLPPYDDALTPQGMTWQAQYRPSRSTDTPSGSEIYTHRPYGVPVDDVGYTYDEGGGPNPGYWDYIPTFSIRVHEPPHSQWELFQQVGHPASPPPDPPPPDTGDCPDPPPWPYDQPSLNVGPGPSAVLRMR